MMTAERPRTAARSVRVERGPALAREGRVVPLRSGEPWNYCGKCGRAMAWYKLPRQVHSRTTGELVDVFTWECSSFLPHETGGDRHDHMSRVVYDPSLPVAETT